MPEKLTCSTCPYFDPPRQPPAKFDLSQDFSGIYTKGECQRVPQFVAKRPEAPACGEHPTAIGARTELLKALLQPILDAVRKLKR